MTHRQASAMTEALATTPGTSTGLMTPSTGSAPPPIRVHQFKAAWERLWQTPD